MSNSAPGSSQKCERELGEYQEKGAAKLAMHVAEKCGAMDNDNSNKKTTAKIVH